MDDGTNYVKSVGRAVSLLMIMAQAGQELSLTELSTKANTPVSTVHRLVNTLMAYNLVEQNQENGKYRLGLEVLHLGTAVLHQLDLRQEALPYMKELAEISGETVNLCVLDGHEVVYIEKVEGSSSLRVFARIGHRAPVYCTGAGKVLLSEMSLDDVRSILGRQGMAPLTPNTITTFKGFLQALEFARVHGYAVDEEECEIGASCLAAPVRDYRGKIVASLSVSGASVRLGPDRRPEMVSQLLRISRELSERMGYRPDALLQTSRSSV